MGRTRIVLGLAAILAIAVTGTDAADAKFRLPPLELLCAYSGAPDNTVTFTVGEAEQELSLTRVGDEIKLYSAQHFGFRRHGKPGFRNRTFLRSPPCKVTPTVHNTDVIRVFMDSESDLELDVQLGNGPLSPGATPESDGTSEIEMQFLLREPGQEIIFDGGSSSELFRFGTLAGVRGVNVNAQDEAAPDIDATMAFREPLQPFENESGEWPSAEAHTGGGDDTVTTSGGPEFDASFGGAFFANGGPGHDTIVGTDQQFTAIKGAGGGDFLQGGPGVNVIFGGSGADTITGGPHQDVVEPGKGRDLAVLDGGKDVVAAGDRTHDRILCGASRDVVVKDRKDRTPGCERKVFGIVHLKPFE